MNEQKQPQWLTTATVQNGLLVTSQRLYFEDRLREEIGPTLEQVYGPGNWLIVPTDDLPEGYDPATYTIKDGQLVPASDEVMALRHEAETRQKASTIRMQRNDILKETDRYMIPDFPLTDAGREQYRAYRQYLRDLPESDGFPDVPVMTFEEFIGAE